jgi:pilus assembly protein Flp/PilA
MKALFTRFVKEDAGQDLIEYGLLVGLITAAVVLLIGPIGTVIVGYYQTLSDNLGI